MRFAKFVIAALSAGFLTLGYVAIRETRENERLSQLILLTVYHESDVERKAVTELARIRGESEASIRARRIPILIELEDKNCVSLELKQDYLGSSEAVCFDKQTGRFLRSFSSGE